MDAITVRHDWGPDWHGFCDIPVFLIDTDSKADAQEKAENIVDPLHMTDVHIEVVRVSERRPSFLARIRKTWKVVTSP